MPFGITSLLVGSKTKILIGISIFTFTTIGFLWWQNGNLQEDIGFLNSENNQLEQSLETTRNTVFTLKAEMELIDDLAEKEKSKRKLVQKENNSLEKSLQNEKNSNIEFQKCLQVETGEFNKKLKQMSPGEENE